MLTSFSISQLFNVLHILRKINYDINVSNKNDNNSNNNDNNSNNNKKWSVLYD